MTTGGRWIAAINDACADTDRARSNQRITQLHYFLSEALANQLGREGGPNFHSWAVWGSQKAGATIRQEDLPTAIRNATAAAGIVGTLTGAATGIITGRMLRWSPNTLTAAIGSVVGAFAGAYTGRQIAIWSREKAAELILRGNQIVIQDIGEQSARFLQLLEEGATTRGRHVFFAGLRPGPSERGGQARLATAFRCYLAAFDAHKPEEKRAAMIAGNCEIVHHEHIRLEPYIQRSMPFIVRHCTTQRWMTYQIGDRALAVGEDVPGESAPTAARNWTKIDERMRYIFALFKKFHADPEVFSAPRLDIVLSTKKPSATSPQCHIPNP